MKKALNWKEVGQVFSVFLGVFTVIRDTFTSQGIGLEIVEWLIGDGKEAFIKQFLTPLGEAFLAAQRVVVVDENTIRVNLDAPPKLPFDGATVETNRGGGWVTVQKRSDGLYVDGRKIILHRSEHQKGGKHFSGYPFSGYELRDELGNMEVLHPNLLDALCDYAHLIPEDWKQNGNVIFIYFLAVTYSSLDDHVYVCFLKWGDGAWSRDYCLLNQFFGVKDLTAVLA